MSSLISFLFRRLDIRWKSNRNLRNDKLDYSHLTKFENAGYQDLIADKRKGFLVHFQPNYGCEDNGLPRRLDYFSQIRCLRISA